MNGTPALGKMSKGLLRMQYPHGIREVLCVCDKLRREASP